MNAIRIIRTTALLLLVGGMFAGSAVAQGHSQDPGKAKGHDKQQQGQAKGHEKPQGQAKGRDRELPPQAQAAQQQARLRQAQQQQAVAARQQRSIAEQRQRETQYRSALDRQLRVAQTHAAQLQQQNRRAQLAAQQQYLVNLRQQQQRLRAEREYARDPAFSALPAYRYVRSGVRYQTTQYGADVLRQAVNYGYEQGYQAGQADRRDGWRSNYQDSYAYQDANYGFDARYVSQADYNYYFRQGVQRGYQDGYGTLQYGTISNGRPSILSSIVSAILGLVAIK